ncbi:MAG TPA: thioredoxin family protein [Chloroflexia bacterium]|nr:thioredoxin family protein [Chloroflexia bacterium]
MTIAETTNFETEVFNSDLPVVVYFWATWCQSCKMMSPHMEAMARDNAGRYRMVKVDIGANPELADKYNILSTPTMLLFRPGSTKPEEVQVGFAARPWVEQNIERFLSR